MSFKFSKKNQNLLGEASVSSSCTDRLLSHTMPRKAAAAKKKAVETTPMEEEEVVVTDTTVKASSSDAADSTPAATTTTTATASTETTTTTSTRPSRKSKETAKRVIHKAIHPKDAIKSEDDEEEAEEEEDGEEHHAPRLSYAAMKKKKKAEILSKRKKPSKKHESDESDQDFAEEESSESEEEVKKKKKKPTKKKTSSKKTKKSKKDEDADDESDDDGEKKKKKKRKTSKTDDGSKRKRSTKSSSTKKKKIKPGMCEVSDEMIEKISELKDEAFTDPSDVIHTNVSPVRTSKEIFRALLTKNYTLLKTILEDTKNVNNVWINRSVDLDWNAFDFAIRANDLKALEMLYEEKDKHRSRAHQSQSIPSMDTGRVGRRTFGHAIRSVNVSRGGREGIDVAFAKDSGDYNNQTWFNVDESIKRCIADKSLKTETVDYLITKEGLGSFGEEMIYYAVEAGNLPIAIHLAEKLILQEGFGLNQLHVEALTLDGTKTFTAYKSVSVPKKALAHAITPVHFAAINPHTQYLKELVEGNSDGVSIQDEYQKRPLHFAACSSTPDNIKYLLEKGANITEKDSQKRTPLHYAAKYGHTQNIEILCPAGSKNGAIKDKFGYTPLHIAAWNGHAETITKLVECGTAVDVAAKLKETPLMSAVKRGHMNVVEALIEKGAKVEKMCARKKSLLMYAAMNGHFELCRFLLKKGLDPNHQDSAGNSVMHYAVAYGWFDIVKLLLAAGADLHALNSWKYSPLNISMLKSHYGITEFILDDKGVDLNLKDSEGLTLIHKLMQKLTEQDVNQIKYLIQTKRDRLDLTVTDGTGRSLFHYITGYPGKFDLELAQLFLECGLNPDLPDNNSVTPLMNAFNNSNIKMIKLLLEKGSRVRCKKHEENILHTTLKQVMNKDLNKLFNIIYDNMVVNKKVYEQQHSVTMEDDVTDEAVQQSDIEVDNVKDSEELFFKMANTVDGTGKTPLMTLIASYSNGHLRQHELAEDSDGEATPYPTTVIDTEKNNPFNIMFDQDELPKKKVAKKKKVEEEDEEIIEGESSSSSDEDVSEMEEENSENEESFIDDTHQEEEEEDEVMEDPIVAAPIFAMTTPVFSATTTTAAVELDSDGEPYEYDTWGGKRKKREIPTGQTTDLFLKFLRRYLDVTKADIKKAKIVHITDSDKIRIKDPITGKMKVRYYPANECIGYTPLHFAVIRQQAEMIKEYITSFGLDINAKDLRNVTPLHLAVHLTKENESMFNVVKFLLKHGAELNAMDSVKRTPFFYAFTSIDYCGGRSSGRSYNYRSSSDPIEIVSDMCNFEGIILDGVDKYGRSPLHYAALYGSTISTIFLIQRGGELNRKDEDGNTPTNMALLSGKVDFTVTLINKGGSVYEPIVDVSTYGGDLSISAREILRRSLKKKKKDEKRVTNVIGKRKKPVYDDSDEEEESDYNSDDSDSEEVKPIQQFMEEESSSSEEDEETIYEQVAKQTLNTQTMFKYALSRSFTGLAYLIIQEPNIAPTQVISDALNTQQYALIQKLIRKTKVEHLSSDKNAEGQNVLHVVAAYQASDSYWKNTWSVTITKMLLRRHVNINLQDNKGRTPLHYAVINNNEPLTKLLLKCAALPNILDNKYKRSALIYASKGGCSHAVIEDLIQYNADTNIVETKYGRTALHFAAQHCNQKVIKPLLNAPKNNPNIKDKKEHTPLHLATLKSDAAVVKLILLHPNIKVNEVDADKRSALHHAVGTGLFGSVLNVELVKALIEGKADVTLLDKDGKSPLYYSYRQSNGIYTELLLKQNKTAHSEELKQKATSEIKAFIESISKYPIEHVDVSVDDDATEAVRLFEEEQASKPETEEEKKDRIPKMDKFCALKNCEVLVDESQSSTSGASSSTDELKYFHTVLNKTDVKYGSSGYNNFYILQVGFNAGQQLWVLFNRYGRVGEDGMYQTTPYQNKDEAVAEFKKIFKSKTGNEWGKDFEEKTKKYKVVDVSKRKVKDPLKPIDLDKSAKTTLPKSIYELMKLVCDITILRKDLGRLGISDEYFSLGNLSKERLKRGHQVLNTILTNIKDMDANPTMPPSDKLVKLNELADLSNEFYSLIPHKNCVNCAIQALNSEYEVRQKMTALQDLIELRTAARILLASSLKKDTMNPLDYTYHALSTKMAPLSPSDEEYSVIKKYIHADHKFDVFRVERSGESERFDNFIENQKKEGKDITRMLLWHGSPVTNFLSILSKGLLIAPPEAPVSGYMFGKGIYCADMFTKSHGYCRSDVSEGESLLLLCEVAVGNPYRTYTSEYMEKAKDGFDSTMGVGRYGPNPNHPFVQYDGVKIPTGHQVETPKPAEEVQKNHYWNFSLNYNEYIVYNIDQVRVKYLVRIHKDQ